MTQQNPFSEQMAPLFAMSRDAVLGLDKQCIVWLNPAAETLFGSAAVGRNIREILPPFPLDPPSEQFVFSAEIRGQAVSVACATVDTLRLLTITRTTEPTRVPYQLLNEIRASVFSLRLAADQLIQRLVGSLDPRVASQTSTLYHNYYSIQRLVNNLYTTGLIADNALHLTRSSIDLKKNCAQLVKSLQPYAQKKQLSLEYHCGEGHFHAQLDWSRIEQMLLNLFSNSLRHTPPGGQILFTLASSGLVLALTVQDSGEGIPPERLSDVFTLRGGALSDVRGGGTGLFIARGIAQAHGGKLLIHSHVGQGTTVQVLLPQSSQSTLTFRDGGQDLTQASGNNLLMELSGVLSSDSYIPLHFR